MRPAAYWLNSTTPFEATPIGPSGVSDGVASLGVAGIRKTMFWLAMRFGFTWTPAVGAS